ncbi:hypothetical protein Q4566_12835 [Tamlana sp. 2_MG-2023]|uniref:hypothetical protein n=1 Tax=unclassified Tamlana TaxID=2614803 RepID=UPI0026E257FF|nr:MULTISPECIES: hypothetical protein [unclassified Tamlana]MDO6761089.1 hypothetical protein [Tamlana sp. 2_MG-2023]MDO6791578.1 hypothetical protein [Tamlana sp. 1_MG-2023]
MKTEQNKEQNTKDKKQYNSDVTKEDLKALDEKTKHLRTDGGQDKYLKDRTKPVDFEGKDLDIPGRSKSKAKPDGNLSDEENRHHSLGSSDNSHLENNFEK